MSRVADPKTKIALLRAAEEVFASKGLEGAKVEDITRRAGTSKGAYYLHFSSKEEAFRHVVESFLARCSGILPPPEAMPGDESEAVWLEAWLRIDREMFEFLWANRAIVAILLRCQGDHVYLLDAFEQEIHARSVAWMAHWKKQGLFRKDVDCELAATVVGGAYHELCRRMIASREKPPVDEWLRGVQAIFARGLGAPRLIQALDGRSDPPVSIRIQGESRGRARAAKVG
jgi:AcrR family transcriptional regulator